MKIGKLFWGRQTKEVKMEAAKEERVLPRDGILILEEEEEKSEIASRNVRKALEILHTDLKLTVISDPIDIMDYGITEQPAFMLNGKILAKGRMLTTTDWVQLLHNYT